MYNNKDSNSIPISMGSRIRKEREKYTLSREKFAEMIELSSFYIGQIERGERRMSLQTALKISETLNLSIDYILKGDHAKLPNNTILEEYESNMENNENEINKSELKELFEIISNATPNQITLIKDLCKILIPHIKK